jgi:hypothetical protein
VLGGLALNRICVTLLALRAPARATYFSHWMELTISVDAIAAGVLIFALAARIQPVFPEPAAETI